MSDCIINKTIRIATMFKREALLEGEIKPTISFNMYYPVDSHVPVMTGVLDGNNRQPVHYKASNGFKIDGELITIQNAEEMVMAADLYYGNSPNRALQSHFEGTVVVYPFVAPPVPPIPPIPPEPPHPTPPPVATDALSTDFAIEAPLFPYLYVQPWPVETAEDLWLQFIEYDTAKAPDSSLYHQLIAPAQSKERSAMESLAIHFLQNEPPFENQYFNNLSHIPEPYSVFPLIYDQLVLPGTAGNEEAVFLQHLYLDSAALLQQAVADYDATVIDQVWQNYFALTIITGYNTGLFLNLNKIIIIYNLLQKLYNTPAPYPIPDGIPALQTLLLATIILPGIPSLNGQPVFPLPSYTPAKTAAGDNWIKPYAVGQLKMAKYRLLRYQQGEIAQIQNVLKGEKKKVVHRLLTSTAEQNKQHTKEVRDTRNEDAESTNELLLETRKTIAALTKTITYNDLNTTYGPPTQALLKGGYTEAITAGEIPGEKDTNHFASLVLNKTLSRINASVLKTRTVSRFSEQEEVSSSIYDNGMGTQNLRGIYCWVNKVYRISIHNYGSRFLLEFYIHRPADPFIAAQQSLNNINLQKPLSPQQQQPAINSFEDITPDNYIALVSYYGIAKIMLPPDESVVVSMALHAGETEKNITLPTGYMAQEARLAAQIAGDATLTTVTGIIGTTGFAISNTTPQTVALQQEVVQLPITVITDNIPAQPPVQVQNFILNVAVICKVGATRLNEWKIAVYDEIMAAYERKMNEYNEHLTRYTTKGDQTQPLLLNNIERSALYQRCTALLLDNTVEKTGNAPGIDPPVLEVNQQRYLQFAEEAFEWNEMTYSFDDQPSRLSYALQGDEDSLRPFLQAGQARVFLPVKPAFNLQVLYYLTSGTLWPNAYPFVPVHEADVSAASHIKKVYGWDKRSTEEKAWNITLPTAMQVIQESNLLPQEIKSMDSI